MTATDLRRNVYQVLAHISETGERAVITHRGRTFLLIPEAQTPLMERPIPHATLRVPPEQLVAAEAAEWDRR